MNTNLTRISILMVLIVSSFYRLDAQDAVFSQFYASPMQINPAFTGNTYNPFISLQYRNQWPTLKAYVTYSATYDQTIPDLNIGAGLQLLSDDAGNGLFKTNQVSGFFSYDINIGNDIHTKIGVDAGYIQTRLNWDKLIFLDQLDPRYGPLDASGNQNISGEPRPDNLSKGILDVGAGVLVFNNTYYGGLSFKHITSPDASFLSKNNNLFVGLPSRITAQVGAQYDLAQNSRSEMFVSPNIMYVRQGEFSQLNAGAYLAIEEIFFGAWYRYAGSNTDAVIGLVGFQKDIFKIGYSYDFTLSKLSGQSGGSHEISLTLNFDKTEGAKRRSKQRDMNDCFKMFR